LAAHVGRDADQKVENDQLVRTAVVEPLIQAGGLPDRVEVQANGVAGGNHSARNDVVAVEKRSGNRLADPIDVNGGSGDEGNDEADGRRQQTGDHQHTEPTHINAVVGGGHPLAEAFPATAAAAAKCSGHGRKENGLAARSGPSTLRTGRQATTGRNQTSNPFNKLQAPFSFFAIKTGPRKTQSQNLLTEDGRSGPLCVPTQFARCIRSSQSAFGSPHSPVRI
jgi:hypothetical protein